MKNWSGKGAVMVAVLLLASVGSMSVVSAQQSTDNPAWGEELYTEVQGMVGAYNDNAGSLDLPVSLAGATNVYVTKGGETATYTIYMDENHRITSVEQGTDADAKRKMTMSKATLDGIANSNDPAGAFKTAVANDDVTISGESGEVVESIKWVVVNALKGFFL